MGCKIVFVVRGGTGMGRKEGKCECIQARPQFMCGALRLGVTLYIRCFFFTELFSVLTLIKRGFYSDVVCF